MSFKMSPAITIASLCLCSVARGDGSVVLFPVTFPSGSIGSLPSDFAAGQAVSQEELSDGISHALLYTNPLENNSPTIVDLTPTAPGSTNAYAQGTDGAQQVGAASQGGNHAFLWSGTSASGVDLNPTGLSQISNSFANAVAGIQQVGSGGTGSVSHAILWKGTAASAIDLNKSGIASSVAYGTDGIQQVGQFGGFSTANSSSGKHAALWSGTAASGVDLNPGGFVDSNATACAPGSQVGYGGVVSNGNYSAHALVWSGTASSAIDLNPAGFTYSLAYGTNGADEVGYGATTGYVSGAALYWAGSAANYTNLQQLLPTSGTWTSSKAYSIDQIGIVFGSASGTFAGYTGQFAVEWVPSGITAPVVVTAASPYYFPANSGTGLLVRKTLGLALAPNANAYVTSATNLQNRQLVIVDGSGLFLSGNSGNWTSKLDVANNDLDLPGALLGTVTNQVRQGYANGAWTGNGLISSTAASNAKHLTALGVIANDNDTAGLPIFSTARLFDGLNPGIGDVLVKYTYFGDANLDGKIDGSDYSLIDAGYIADQAVPASITGWYHGDFNYDGVIDGSDYTLIDNAFNNQGAQVSPTLLVATVTEQVARPAAVPEPSASILTGLIAIGVCRRSLRRHSR